MQVEFLNSYKIHGLDVECNISLVEGNLYHVIGPNGAGKSTFFHYLKLNASKYFLDKKVVFVDQQRISPINDISYTQVEKDFAGDRQLIEPTYSFIRELVRDFESLPICTLSGGQNQIVKIAMALHFGGDIYFLDEPLQYLDKDNSEKVVSLIEKLKDAGKTVVLIEHQQDKIKHLVNKVINIDFDLEKVWIKNGN